MKHTVTRDRRRMLRADYAALGPYSLWALLFILVPLVFVAYYAFTDNNFQFTLKTSSGSSPPPPASSRRTAPRRRCTPTCSSSGAP